MARSFSDVLVLKPATPTPTGIRRLESMSPAAPAILGLLIAAVLWGFFSYGYIEDDAFIHLEFARSVSEGAGFSFNGRLVNGDTAPLWVLMLVAVHAIGLTWIGAAKVLCTIGIGVALTGVWSLCRSLGGGAPRHGDLPWLGLLVVALNPYFVHWSFSGMEAVTALGVSLWIIWAGYARAPWSWRRILAGAILVSIAPLLRPELLLLAAITGPALLLGAWNMGEARPGRRIVRVALLSLLMVTPLVLWGAYAMHAFGAVVPNTNAAKRAGELLAVVSKLASVYMVGFSVTLVTFPFVMQRLRRSGIPPAIWVLVAWPLACMCFYILDHTAVQTRYCLLSMPSLALATLWLLEETIPTRWARAVTAATAAAGLAVIALIVIPHVRNKVTLVSRVSLAARFIRENIAADAPIAVFSIGQLAFEGQHPLIDIGGITRPQVLPYANDLPATLRWAKSEGARYYIGGTAPSPGAARLYSYEEPFLGWSFDRSKYSTVTTTGIYRLD